MLAHIPIFLPEETKDGHKPWILCCPFCAYTVQNDPAFPNHVVNAHYQANFTCGTCLSALTTSGQQMKRHISECPGLPTLPDKSSQGSTHGGSLPKKRAHGSSGSKSKHKGSKHKHWHHPDKSQSDEKASQEGSQTGDCRLTCAAGASQESTARSSHWHSSGKKRAKKTHKKKKKSGK